VKCVPATRCQRYTYLENIFDDPLLIVVAGLQVFYIELEQIQGSGSCRMERRSQNMETM